MPLVGGAESASFGLFPPSLLFPLLFTMIMSLVVRGKIKVGRISCNSPINSRLVAMVPESVAGLVLTITAFFSLVFAPFVLFVVAALRNP